MEYKERKGATMNENSIRMIPTDWLAHHPDNPRQDLGDLTELAASIKANGIMQNLTIVESQEQPGDTDGICHFWVVIGNRRLEAARMAGLKELPCVLSDMDHREQIATMLEENMHRADLTVWEQAKGIQTMMDLGFTKDEVSEKTGFSKTTIERRLAVATLPEKQAKEAVGYGYDLLDLVEISKIEDRKKQEDLLKGTPVTVHGIDTAWLRQRIRSALQDQEKQKILDVLLKEIQTFAKPMKNSSDRWSNKYEQVGELTIKIEEGAKVKYPKENGNYYYCVSYGDIEFYLPVKRDRHQKTEAEIAFEKRQHDAKELNERMRENRIAFCASFTPSKMQEAHLKAKLWDYVFGWKCRYLTNGEFFTSYHSLSIDLFRKLAGMPKEEGKDPQESLLEEIERRNIPKGRAILAWMLCGGIRADDRPGYASQYDGNYKKDEDMDDVYTILMDNGYQMTEEEQQWRDGTHPFFRKETK